jgi:hypothetical protein
VPVKDVMFNAVALVAPDDTVGDARYHDAVVEHGYYMGRIYSTEIAEIRREQRSMKKVVELVKSNVVAYFGETAWEALKKMRESNLDLIPVAEREAPDKIIGVSQRTVSQPPTKEQARLRS